MYLFGDSLTKSLATAVALLTVLTGLPYVRCVCPDGRVKLFCAGPSRTGCCCASSHSAAEVSTANASCCSEAEVSNRAPDAGQLERDATPSCGDDEFVLKPCGCERTLVTDAGASVAEEGCGGAERFDQDCVIWSPLSAISESTFYARRVSPCLLPPPDLVVRFCHFTC